MNTVRKPAKKANEAAPHSPPAIEAPPSDRGPVPEGAVTGVFLAPVAASPPVEVPNRPPEVREAFAAIRRAHELLGLVKVPLHTRGTPPDVSASLELRQAFGAVVSVLDRYDGERAAGAASPFLRLLAITGPDGSRGFVVCEERRGPRSLPNDVPGAPGIPLGDLERIAGGEGFDVGIDAPVGAEVAP
jgi:hypothetical protein